MLVQNTCRENEKHREGEREREGEEGSRANYGPKKTKGYISMIPPAVLFMSCVLSLCDLHLHTCPL